jgi:hypothetical protein
MLVVAVKPSLVPYVIVVEIVFLHTDHRKLVREPDVAGKVDRRYPAAVDLMQDLISLPSARLSCVVRSAVTSVGR